MVKIFLVDAGYVNTPQFLAPYRGTRYHLQEQGRDNQKPHNYKELFNLRHAQLRSHIEKTIGILKKRFPILRTDSHYPLIYQLLAVFYTTSYAYIMEIFCGQAIPIMRLIQIRLLMCQMEITTTMMTYKHLIILEKSETKSEMT
jgi:hypothetical protein